MYNYSYTEFATGVSNRGNIVDIRKVPALLKKHREQDCYINTLLFQESFETFVANTGSVQKYRGEGKLNYFPVDIDSTDLNASLEALRNFIEKLNLNDVPTMYLRYYFSGSKGFHVMIPNTMIGTEPSESISRYMKKMGSILLDDELFDSTIYTHVRLFRLPNTKHQKSGLYKVPLTYNEVMMKSLSQIKEMAAEPRFDVDKPKYQGERVPFLNSLWREAVSDTTSIYKVKQYDESEQYRFPCHRHLFEQGATEGHRNNTALRAAWILKKYSGLTQELVFNTLKGWNEKNKPPLSEPELHKVVEQAFRGNYHFGCSDSIMSLYCDDNCPLLKKRELEEKEEPVLVSMSNMAEGYKQFVDLCEKNPVKFFHPVDKYIRSLFPGFVAYIMARSGVGKTSFVIDVIVRMVQAGLKVMFFSLEMPLTMIYERLASRVLNIPYTELPKAIRNPKMKREFERVENLLSSKLIVTDKTGLTLSEMEEYMRFAEERVFGSKIQCVLADYFGLIRPETVSDSNYQNKTKLADELQQFAKRNKVPVITLLQTNRSGQEGRNEINLASGRDSGHIEEVADLMLGLWKIEDSVYLKILKNRYGKSDLSFEAIVNRETNHWAFEEVFKIGYQKD